MQSLTTSLSGVQAHAQEFQGFLLERRADGEHGKARGRILSRLHDVSDKRSQVLEQSPERLDGQSFLGHVKTGLLLGRRRGDGGTHDVRACLFGSFPVFFRKQKRRQLLFHLPFRVIRQHAQEDVAFDPVGKTVIDRPDLEIHGLEAPEGPFHRGERLVGLDALFRGHHALGKRGADHIEPVERRLVLNLSRVG